MVAIVAPYPKIKLGDPYEPITSMHQLILINWWALGLKVSMSVCSVQYEQCHSESALLFGSNLIKTRLLCPL